MLEKLPSNIHQLIAAKQLSSMSSMADLRASEAKLLKLKDARELASKILKRYPDYAKCTPEYLAAITEVLASCDYRTQRRLEDIITGISARHAFLPTVADFVKFVDELNPRASTFNRSEYRVLNEPRQPFRPYPKLWEAFADEPHLLKVRDSLNFDRLTQASKRLATEGREAARAVLDAA